MTRQSDLRYLYGTMVKHRAADSRPSASQRGYDARWRRARASYLRQHPLCVPCKDAGQVTPATLVHHKIPHRGDTTLFWDVENWEGRCTTCHADAQVGESTSSRSETYRGARMDGVPMDPAHHWNRA